MFRMPKTKEFISSDSDSFSDDEVTILVKFFAHWFSPYRVQVKNDFVWRMLMDCNQNSYYAMVVTIYFCNLTWKTQHNESNDKVVKTSSDSDTELETTQIAEPFLNVFVVDLKGQQTFKKVSPFAV